MSRFNSWQPGESKIPESFEEQMVGIGGVNSTDSNVISDILTTQTKKVDNIHNGSQKKELTIKFMDYLRSLPQKDKEIVMYASDFGVVRELLDKSNLFTGAEIKQLKINFNKTQN